MRPSRRSSPSSGRWRWATSPSRHHQDSPVGTSSAGPSGCPRSGSATRPPWSIPKGPALGCTSSAYRRARPPRTGSTSTYAWPAPTSRARSARGSSRSRWPGSSKRAPRLPGGRRTCAAGRWSCGIRRETSSPRARSRSGHAELVSLRIPHDHRPAAHVLLPPGNRGARFDEPGHLLLDEPRALLALDVGAGHAYVEVDPVLGGLALRYALEVHPRAGPFGIDQGGLVAEPLLGHPDGPAELVPTGESWWWRLGDVAQRQRPELGELRRLGRIEHYLDLGVHGQHLRGRLALVLTRACVSLDVPSMPSRTQKSWQIHGEPAPAVRHSRNFTS